MLLIKRADYLSYIVESANTAGNAVELLSLKNYSLKIIASDTLEVFPDSTGSVKEKDFAFFKAFKHKDYEEENATVHGYINLYNNPTLKTFDPQQTATGFPKDMRVYNGSMARLSDDMSSLFLWY